MATLCETVGPFVDGELGPEEAEAFRQHLPDCEKCHREMTELLQFKLLLSAQQEPAPERLPPAPIPLFRRRSFVAALSALAASVLVVFGVLRVTPSGPPQDAWLVQRPERLLEARLGYSRADVYRPPAAKMMGGNGATGDLPHAAFAWLEEHDDVHGLAAAYLVRDDRGFAEHALQKLTELKERSPEVENDRAVALLLAGRPKEALPILDGVLREHPRHAQALWNRGLVLRELGLPLMAARSFIEVAALGEPGWADEAARKAAELQRVTYERRDRWKASYDAGRALALVDAPLSILPQGFVQMPSAPAFFYDAIRAAPNRERVLELLPLARELDARAGNSVLEAYARRIAESDFSQRAPLARRYVALMREFPSREEQESFLEALTRSSEDDILLGMLVTSSAMARHVELFTEKAKATKDAWFELLVAQARSQAALAEGNTKQAVRTLQDAWKSCPAPGLEYRCLFLEFKLADLYRQSRMVDEALDLAERSWKEASASNEWVLEQETLWILAQLARVVNEVPLTRAYMGEFLERGQGEQDAQHRAHQELANMAFQELSVDEARREINAALATGLPLSFTGAFVLADISRLKREPGDEVHLNRALDAVRHSSGAGELAGITHVLGRFYLEQDPERGRELLRSAITEAEAPGLEGDTAARRARAYSYSSLLHDAGRRGDFKAALELFAQERGTKLPGQCLLAVTADSERTLLLVLSPSGELLGHFDESRRQPLPSRLEGLVPEKLLAALRECSRVEVLARPPLHGRAGLLPPEVAWSYLTRAAPPVVQHTGPAVHLVVSNVEPPPGSTLKRLNSWTPSFGPDEQSVTLSGMEATPSRVRDAMRDATEIDLVAHGVIDDGSDSSYLLLAPGQKEDPELSAPQVRTNALRGAPFVVLAACHAAHSTYSLDAPLSLPAAFIDAGARGVLAATVEIPDLEAAAFFNAVRERMRSGAPPALALREERVRWMEQQRGSAWLGSVVLFE